MRVQDYTEDYAVFKFYVPSYGIQSRPIPIKLSLIQEYGWRWAMMEALDSYIAYGLRPSGEQHDSHWKLWVDGRMTHKIRVRKLSKKQASRMRKRLAPVEEKEEVGWKRRYKRKRRR